MVFAAIEDVDQQRHGKPTAAERGANDDVNDDPYAPRIARIDMGDGAEAIDNALQDEVEADGCQSGEHQRCRSYQVSAQRCGGAHGCPPLDFVASSSGTRGALRRAKKARPANATSGAMSH